MKLEIKRRVFNDAYFPFLYEMKRYLHFYGGSGSGKSVFVAQRLILESFTRESDCLVVRKVERTLKESVYKLVKSIIHQWKLDEYFETLKQPMEIINRKTGSKFVFTGLDDPEKIKSIAGFEKIWCEEATELELEDYLELDRRLRGYKHCQIIFSYNPIDEGHWIKKVFHNAPDESTVICKTTYLDNKFIDEHYKATLDKLKSIDENQWRIYALGEWGILNLPHKFDIKKLLQIAPKQPIKIFGGVKFFRDVKQNWLYSMGIDYANGIGDKGDYSAITIRDFYGDKEFRYPLVAQFKGRVGVKETNVLALKVAQIYSQFGSKVIIAPEVNFEGITSLDYLLERYPSELIYKRFDDDQDKQLDPRLPPYGWKTTSKNRTKIINDFAYAFADNLVEICNDDEVEEAKSFIYTQDPKRLEEGRYEAQKGCHDDLLFSDLICLANMEYIAKRC